MTGHSAIWGKEAKTAIETAFGAVDNRIGNYEIEVVWIDSQSDPAKATNAFSEAVEKKGSMWRFTMFTVRFQSP